LLQDGYRLCVTFLKLLEKLYAPLTAGVLDPVSGDANLRGDRLSNLDDLYLAVSPALDNLLEAVGLEAATFWLLASCFLREQNSRYAPHNGLGSFGDFAPNEWPLRGSTSFAIFHF
jgi:hypothetical protein